MISIKYMNNEEDYKNWLLNKYIISCEKRIFTNKNKTFFYNANLMAEKCYIKMNFVWMNTMTALHLLFTLTKLTGTAMLSISWPSLIICELFLLKMGEVGMSIPSKPSEAVSLDFSGEIFGGSSGVFGRSENNISRLTNISNQAHIP